MYHVLICDDDIQICEYIEQILIDYCKTNMLELSTEVFYSGEQLFDYMTIHNDIDLIFLDIQLPGTNGAQIGTELRNKLENETVQIVFISYKDSYAMQLFQVRPFDFIIKPLCKDTIIRIFKKYLSLYGNKYRFFEYTYKWKTEKIQLSEIMYFMSEKRKICIVTSKNTYSFYGNIKELHKNMGEDGFWSVHNCYIINIKYVKLFRENEIVMCNDHVIPISRSYKNEVKQKIALLGEEL